MKSVRDAWIQGLKLRFQQQRTSYTAFELRLTGSRNCSAIGYLLGALDMLASTLPPTVCYPKNTGISAYEVKAVVYQYMLNHPDSTGIKPDKLVYQALTEHWPCR